MYLLCKSYFGYLFDIPIFYALLYIFIAIIINFYSFLMHKIALDFSFLAVYIILNV